MKRDEITAAEIESFFTDLQRMPAVPVGEHPSEDETIRYLQDELEPEGAARIEEHLASCAVCAERAGDLLEAEPAWTGLGERILALAGPAVATPERLRGLLANCQSQVAEIRVAAARKLEEIGAAAATPDVLAAVDRLLEDQDADVRAAAVGALSAMRTDAPTPSLLEKLTACLGDRTEPVREAATRALLALGPAAATPAVITDLLARLDDKAGNVRRAAAEALGQMGAPAATPAVIEALRARLIDVDTRQAAAMALGRMGASPHPTGAAPPARPSTVSALIARLRGQLEELVLAVPRLSAAGAHAQALQVEEGQTADGLFRWRIEEEAAGGLTLRFASDDLGLAGTRLRVTIGDRAWEVVLEEVGPAEVGGELVLTEHESPALDTATVVQVEDS